MSDSTPVWPELPVAQWVDTRDTLQLMTQVVGKIRLANTPLINHWWNVPLYVTARGSDHRPDPAWRRRLSDRLRLHRPPARSSPDRTASGAPCRCTHARSPTSTAT